MATTTKQRERRRGEAKPSISATVEPAATPSVSRIRGDSLTESDAPDDADERLVRSQQRVRELGEVFTPRRIVQKMLDLLPADTWEPHPSATFLEPSAGDGNFLVAIYDRKAKVVLARAAEGRLPAGDDAHAIQFHLLEALASIYAVDISEENVFGGTEEHPLGSRERLLAHVTHWHSEATGKPPAQNSRFLKAARRIVEWNLIVGNMLPVNPDGSPSGTDDIPLIEYEWDPANQHINLRQTTLGACLTQAEEETSDTLSLFGYEEPPVAWSGPALAVAHADVNAVVDDRSRTRNGRP